MSQGENERHFEEDLRLAKLVIARNNNACKQFYARFSPGLLRRLCRLVGNLRDAEDCLQQVFLIALDKMEQYQGKGPLGGWINRIASHVVYRKIQRRSRLQTFAEGFWSSSETKAEEPLPDGLFLQQELIELVRELVQRLPPQKRMAILMCDIEGRVMEEAASELGIPLGTFVSRLYSGRRELKKLLEREGERQGLSIGDWIHG